MAINTHEVTTEDELEYIEITSRNGNFSRFFRDEGIVSLTDNTTPYGIIVNVLTVEGEWEQTEYFDVLKVHRVFADDED